MKRPDVAEVMELHLAGVLSDEDRNIVADNPRVRVHGFLGHRDTLSLVRGADLLFLPLYDVPPSRRAAIVPHKTYEYLASGRPILAALPPGDARDLLETSPNGRLCDPTDVGAMAEILVAEFDRRHASAGPVEAGRPGRDAATLAEEMAATLRSTLERSSERRDAVAA
jgi:glycosyltransferase involved in cell wall biosynthesis